MAANSSAHPARAGYNQSGGAYFICMSDLETRNGAGLVPTSAGFINTLATTGSNSGGAWVPPSLQTVIMSNVLSASSAGQASTMANLVSKGSLIKDMGRTVISSGRTFRKFAPVVGNAGTQLSFGIVGSAGVSPNAGYGSFYLEVGREGQGSATPAPIARYF